MLGQPCSDQKRMPAGPRSENSIATAGAGRTERKAEGLRGARHGGLQRGALLFSLSLKVARMVVAGVLQGFRLLMHYGSPLWRACTACVQSYMCKKDLLFCSVVFMQAFCAFHGGLRDFGPLRLPEVQLKLQCELDNILAGQARCVQWFHTRGCYDTPSSASRSYRSYFLQRLNALQTLPSNQGAPTFLIFPNRCSWILQPDLLLTCCALSKTVAFNTMP